MTDERFCVHVYGRVHGLTRAGLDAAVARIGGRLLRTPSSRATIIAIGHSTAMVALIEAPPLALPSGLSTNAQLVSELTLKRMLGLAPPLEDEHRTLTANDVARQARLDPEVVRCLSLYDVVEPASGRFGFRDLRAAREVRRLLDLSIALDEIVEAAVALRRAGKSLSDTRLSEAPWGEIVAEVGTRLGRLNGQLTLPLDEAFATVDEVFERAEQAELECALDEAERQYRIALRMDRTDPVIPFNLGNILQALGRPAEARIAYQESIGRDPSFAEAWLNLAVLHEGEGRLEDAIGSYQQALEVRPEYAEALYNLGSLLNRGERYAEALGLWERYLALPRRLPDAREALRHLHLCRTALRCVTEETRTQ